MRGKALYGVCVLVVAVAMASTLAMAGGNNPWKRSALTIMDDEIITSSASGTSDSYPLGRDSNVLLHIYVTNWDNGGVITLTPNYDIPGGNFTSSFAHTDATTDEITLTNTANVSTATYIRSTSFLKGAANMQWTATCDVTSSDPHINIKAFGFDDDDE
jgi:hypothetical protein